jgi:hypothetical protein
MVIGLRCHSNQRKESSSFFFPPFSLATTSDITAYPISDCQPSSLQHIVGSLCLHCFVQKVFTSLLLPLALRLLFVEQGIRLKKIHSYGPNSSKSAHWCKAYDGSVR